MATGASRPSGRDPSAEEVARALGKAQRAGKGWKTRCPAHEDDEPSLSLTDSSNGKLLWNCHAGCSQEAVRQALQERGLLRRRTVRSESIHQVYVYRDRRRRTWAEVHRWDLPDGRKKIRPRRPDGSWGIPDGPRPLYRLAELLENPDVPVLVVEGEKVVDAAMDMAEFEDWAVVTSMSGSKAAGKSDWSTLEGREVVIWPDSDSAGAAYARTVAELLEDVADTVSVIRPPAGAYPKGWDLADPVPKNAPSVSIALSDYVEDATGGMPDEEETLPAPTKYLLLADAMTDIPDEQNWLVHNLLPDVGTSLLMSDPKAGKSTFCGTLADAIASPNGTDFLGLRCEDGPVLLVSADEPMPVTVRRLRSLGANAERIALMPSHLLDFEIDDRLESLRDVVDEIRPALVVIDTLVAFMRIQDSSDYSLVVREMDRVNPMVREFSTHVLYITHSRKSGGRHGIEAMGSQGFLGSVDVGLSLKRSVDDDDLRLIEVTSRVHHDPPKLVVTYDPDERRTILAEPSKVGRNPMVEERILTWLTLNPDSKRSAIAKAVVGKRSAILRSVAKLIDLGQLREDGEGRLRVASRA